MESSVKKWNKRLVLRKKRPAICPAHHAVLAEGRVFPVGYSQLRQAIVIAAFIGNIRVLVVLCSFITNTSIKLDCICIYRSIIYQLILKPSLREIFFL